MRGMPGGGNMGQMMKQLQKMQKEMQDTQARVEAEVFEATAGGGAIKVECNGRKELVSVALSPEIVQEGDAEIIQDLVLAAVNDVLEKADQAMTNAMGKFSQIPGMF